MLLYRTGLPVVATPYHRAIDGLVEAAKFFAERDPQAAWWQLERLGVRYVVAPYRAHEQLMNFERVAFGELRSYDPPTQTIDSSGRLHEVLHYRPEAALTMAYRLALRPDGAITDVECIARIKEGADTPDGLSGLVYVVQLVLRM